MLIHSLSSFTNRITCKNLNKKAKINTNQPKSSLNTQITIKKQQQIYQLI